MYSEKEIRKEEALMQLLRNFFAQLADTVLQIPEKVTRRLPALTIVGPRLKIPPI